MRFNTMNISMQIINSFYYLLHLKRSLVNSFCARSKRVFECGLRANQVHPEMSYVNWYFKHGLSLLLVLRLQTTFPLMSSLRWYYKGGNSKSLTQRGFELRAYCKDATNSFNFSASCEKHQHFSTPFPNQVYWEITTSDKKTTLVFNTQLIVTNNLSWASNQGKYLFIRSFKCLQSHLYFTTQKSTLTSK